MPSLVVKAMMARWIKHTLVADKVAMGLWVQIWLLHTLKLLLLLQKSVLNAIFQCESHNGAVADRTLVVDKVAVELWVQIPFLHKLNCCLYIQQSAPNAIAQCETHDGAVVKCTLVVDMIAIE